MLDGGEGELSFYHTSCFRILGDWLALVSSSPDSACEALFKLAGAISPDLSDYLHQIRFREVWPKLQRNNPGPTALLSAFNGWFDGLKTMKLIHHLSSVAYPRCEPEITLPDLLHWGGLEVVGGIAGTLEVLRIQQLGQDYRPA